jgi:outer membrane lipoprotein-sorting protein
MPHFKTNSFLLLLVLLTFKVSSQNPRELLHQVQNKLNRANNYKVDIKIKVDLPFISMLPINTKLYFKQKNKLKIDTKSIAIMPKQGFLQLITLLNDTTNYTAILQANEIVSNIKTSLINLIPNNDTSDVILAKLWVDATNLVITKTQVTTKSSGTIKSEYSYGTQLAYGLPDIIKFTVDIKKFKIPKALAADINTSKTKKVEKKSGEITVTFKNYEINKGISNSVFDKVR